MSLEQLTSFLGWCTVLNIGLLLFSTAFLAGFSAQVSEIHARLFKLKSDELASTYFRYLAGYKILIIMFNLVPYLALRIMI